MTTSDSSTTEKPAAATTSDDSRQASPSGSSSGASSTPSTTGSNLKAVLVLLLVLVLVLVAGAGYLVKNNETVARELLSWNVQPPAWLLPASVSQQPVDNGSNTASQSSSDNEGASSQAPSTGTSLGGSGSLGPGSPSDPPASALGGAMQGSASIAAEPPAPIRPAPQLDPAFRKALEDIDRLSRSLSALPAGPQSLACPRQPYPNPRVVFLLAQQSSPMPQCLSLVSLKKPAVLAEPCAGADCSRPRPCCPAPGFLPTGKSADAGPAGGSTTCPLAWRGGACGP
jgi:hypothetical protein